MRKGRLKESTSSQLDGATDGGMGRRGLKSAFPPSPREGAALGQSTEVWQSTLLIKVLVCRDLDQHATLSVVRTKCQLPIYSSEKKAEVAPSPAPQGRHQC